MLVRSHFIKLVQIGTVENIRIQIVGLPVVNINHEWLVRLHQKVVQVQAGQQAFRGINRSIQVTRPDAK